MYLVHRVVARCALMRQWIQDHVSSPVGANLNRVRKLSNLYLCIHWECNEIGARASRSCLVVCKTGGYGPHGFRVHVVTKSRRKAGWVQLEFEIHPRRIANPCRANLSWLGPLLELALCEKCVAMIVCEIYISKICTCVVKLHLSLTTFCTSANEQN